MRTEAGTSRLWPVRLPPTSRQEPCSGVQGNNSPPPETVATSGPCEASRGAPRKAGSRSVCFGFSPGISPSPQSLIPQPPRHLTPGPHPPPRPRPRARLSAPSVSSRLRPRGLRSGTWPRCEAPCLGNVLCSPQRQRDCQRHLHCDSGGRKFTTCWNATFSIISVAFGPQELGSGTSFWRAGQRGEWGARRGPRAGAGCPDPACACCPDPQGGDAHFGVGAGPGRWKSQRLSTRGAVCGGAGTWEGHRRAYLGSVPGGSRRLRTGPATRAGPPRMPPGGAPTAVLTEASQRALWTEALVCGGRGAPSCKSKPGRVQSAHLPSLSGEDSWAALCRS